MEHVERAGVHSGDSMAVYPSQNLSDEIKNRIVDYSIRIGRALNIKGLFNIQFVLDRKTISMSWKSIPPGQPYRSRTEQKQPGSQWSDLPPSLCWEKPFGAWIFNGACS